MGGIPLNRGLQRRFLKAKNTLFFLRDARLKITD